MMWYILALIITGVLILLGGSILLTVYLINTVGRTSIRVVVFSKDKKRKVYKFRHLEKEFTIGKDKFKFNSDFIYRSRNRDWIHYNEGDTHPIDIKTGMSERIDSSTLKDLMDSNLIKQLFSSTKEELFSPSMIVMYIVLILNIIILIINLVNGSADINIANPSNKEFIKTAVMEALR